MVLRPNNPKNETIALTSTLDALSHAKVKDWDGLRWGLGPPWVQFYLFIFLVIKYFIFIVGSSFQNLRPPFSLISLASLNQIATIQSKNLTKTIKTFTMVIAF